MRPIYTNSTKKKKEKKKKEKKEKKPNTRINKTYLMKMSFQGVYMDWIEGSFSTQLDLVVLINFNPTQPIICVD